jgi:predicted DNA binding CopG/RHH family protein
LTPDIRIDAIRKERQRAARGRRDRLNIRLSPEAIHHLKDLAELEGISMSRYVERLIYMATEAVMADR